MSDDYYVYVVNGVEYDWADKVVVVNLDRGLNSSDYTKVYVTNGLAEMPRGRNIRVCNGDIDGPDPNCERIYVVNFDWFRRLRSMRWRFYPELTFCIKCLYEYEDRNAVSSMSWTTCPKCGATFRKAENDLFRGFLP